MATFAHHSKPFMMSTGDSDLGGDTANALRYPDSEAWPRPRYAWYVVCALTAAYTLSMIDRQVLGLVLEPIRRDLRLSDTQVSLLVGSAFALFYVALGVPLGRLADRANRRNLIFSGIFLWSLMTSACGLANTFWQLFAARVGVAVGEATLSPAALSMISDYFPPKKRTRPLAAYFLALAMGAGLAYLLGGAVSAAVANMPGLHFPIIGSRHAWQMVFLVVGTPGMIFALVLLTVREPLRRGIRLTAVSRAPRADMHAVRVREVLHFIWHENRQTLALLFIAYGGFALFADVTLVWMPTILIRRFGWSLSKIGLSMGLVILVSATIGILSGIALASRLQSRAPATALVRTSLIMGLVLTPIGMLVPLANSPAYVLALLAPAVALSFGLFPMGPAIVQLITPNQMRAQVTALFALFNNLMSLTLGATLVGLLTDYVFHDPMRAHDSLLVVTAIVLPLSTYLLWRALAHVERSIVAAGSWIENVGSPTIRPAHPRP
jgi:MFS family permease